jgi:2-methylisocitrate lyase-like PEP mutase family enzyme
MRQRAAARLGEALAQPGIVMAPGAPDSLTARLVEQAGFPAIYMTGFGATASRLGLPDIGLLSQTEMTTHARDMVRAVSIPVIADADTGYGGPANIRRTVEEYVQAGVAAIHLEDQVAPKRCGQRAGIRLIPTRENVRRLEAALAARPAPDDLLIIGRTDGLAASGLEEALERARAYHDAGVDLVFVDGIKRIAEVEAVARHVPGRKVVSIVDGNETTALTARDLEQMGFAIVLYAVTTLFTATRAIREALTTLAVDGTPKALADRQVSYGELAGIVGLPEFETWDERYG